MKIPISIAACALVLFGAACRSSSEKRDRIEARIEKAENAVSTNRLAQIEEAKGWAYGGEQILKRITNSSPELKLAADFTSRVGLILGPPAFGEALKIDEMIEDLLSTQHKEILKGQAALAERDARMVAHQRKEAALETKVGVVEKERDAAYKAAAEIASRYERITGFLWKIVWIVGGLVALTVGLKIAAIACGVPALGAAPDIALGVLGKGVLRLFPGASKSAGVVAADTYQTANKALTEVVTAIQAARKADKTMFEEKLEPHLKNHTDQEDSRPLIAQIVTQLKNASA